MGRRRRQRTTPTKPKFSSRLTLGLAARSGLLLRTLGIDPQRFLTLLELQLLLDARRHSIANQQMFGGSEIMATLVFLAIGFAFGTGLLLDAPVLGVGIAMGGVMTFTTMVIMNDHVASIFDTTDTAIVGPLPVDDRTFFGARAAHVMTNLLRTSLTLGLGSLVIGTTQYTPWIFLPTMFAAIVLSCVLCFVGAVGLILLITRMFGEQRARTVVTFAQILFTFGFVAAGQVLPRMMRSSTFEGVDIAGSWWLALLPPCHFGGLIAVVEGARDPLSVTLAALALGLPAIATLFVMHVATTGFVGRVAAMSNTHTANARPRSPRTLIDRFTKDPSRRAGYSFFKALSRRENQYRLRAYPSILMSVLFGGVLAFAGDGLDPRMACGALYLLAAGVPAMVIPSRFSENDAAHWILRTGPDFRAGRFISGCAYGFLMTLLLPVTLVILAVLLSIGGLAILPHVAYATAASAAVAFVCVKLTMDTVPFSQPVPKKMTAEHVGVAFLSLTFVGLCVAGHVVLLEIGGEPVLVAGAAVAAVIAYLLSRRLRDFRDREPRLRRRRVPSEG